MSDSIQELTTTIRKFADDRDWEQFHSPKNLSMALIVEAGELVEHFQWLSQQQSMTLNEEQARQVALEMADVLIYLVRMADRLNIDLLQAASEKIVINNEKYPADQCRSRADKYSSYRQDT